MTKLAIGLFFGLVLGALVAWLALRPSSTTMQVLPVEPRVEPRPTVLAPEPVVSAPRTEARDEAHTGNVSGRVLDSLTREPVPDLLVRLFGNGLHENLLTNANGEFRSTIDFPSGHLTAALTERDADIERVEREHEAETGTRDWVLEVPLGPTFEIGTIDGASFEPSQWRARLLESEGGFEVAGTVLIGRNSMQSLKGGRAIDEGGAEWFELRAGSPAWIRFAASGMLFDAQARAILVLERKDRARRVVLPDASRVGRHRIADVPSTALASLVATVIGPQGRAVENARALLVPAREDPMLGRGASSLDVREPLVDRDGRVRLDRLEPGPWKLFAWARGTGLCERPLDLAPGTTDLESVSLEADRWAADVESELRPVVVKTLIDGELFLRSRSVRMGRLATSWLTPVLGTGPTEPRDTPVPDCELSTDIVSWTGAPRFWIDPQPSRAPDLSLLKWKIDPTHVRPFRFERTVPPRDGEPARFAVTFGPGGAWSSTLYDALAFPVQLDDRTRLVWTASMPDKRPVFGDESSFHDVEGERVAYVDFQPGFGALLHFRRVRPAIDGHRSPFQQSFASAGHAGVQVLADGKLVATSDAEGTARIALDARPARLSIVAPGWRLAELSEVGGSLPQAFVWLERDE